MLTRNISMPSTVFGGGVFLLLSWGFLSFCHVLQSIYSWRLVSQRYSSTKIKLMDSPNSAVFLWSSLPFSFRSPETDAFILGCWATVLLQLICVVDWVDNRESDVVQVHFRLLHLDPLFMCYPGLTLFPIPMPLY